MNEKIILAGSMSGLGGTETATLRLARLLKRRGHEVLLACSDGPLAAEAQQAGIGIARSDFYRGGLFGYLKAAVGLVKLLRRARPQIVHCQMARIVPACALAAKIASPQTKVFYHARGLNPETYPKIARLFDRLGVYIIGNCRHERDKLIRHGFPAARIAYTYNVLPEHAARTAKPPRSRIVFGTLSRLDKERAVHLALDAVKTLLDKGLDVRLSVAGVGAESSHLKAQAERLQMADKVDFLGGVRDLDAFFGSIDILLNTPVLIGDHGAGVGNNILEAGLYRTPVVSYDGAGISEMVADGETGFCVPLGETARFAESAARLAADADLRRSMGDALHGRVCRLCSDDEIYRTTLAAYRM